MSSIGQRLSPEAEEKESLLGQFPNAALHSNFGVHIVTISAEEVDFALLQQSPTEKGAILFTHCPDLIA
jgi:hypothetical protein